MSTAARAARIQEAVSPGFREASRGRRQYGDAVQSECNTRGFGGAGVAPPKGPGLHPTATFDEETRRVRASLGQSGATGPAVGSRGRSRRKEGVGKVSSQKSRKRKFASASQSEAGECAVCARTRALRPILGGHGKASGLSGLCGQALSGCPVFARRGRVAPRLDQSNGGAGRMRAAPDARGEGEVWARPRPGFIKARSGATRALVASAVPAAPT